MYFFAFNLCHAIVHASWSCRACVLTVFWEQQGLQTFGHRIQITRPQASQPAFDRHFASLVEEYGAVHAINLLGTKENETALTAAYSRHTKSAQHALGDAIGLTSFDFHSAVRLGGHESVFREIRSALQCLRTSPVITDLNVLHDQAPGNGSRQSRQVRIRDG